MLIVPGVFVLLLFVPRRPRVNPIAETCIKLKCKTPIRRGDMVYFDSSGAASPVDRTAGAEGVPAVRFWNRLPEDLK